MANMRRSAGAFLAGGRTLAHAEEVQLLTVKELASGLEMTLNAGVGVKFIEGEES
jgi:hypothetical protein